jgi:hypothetical protein
MIVLRRLLSIFGVPARSYPKDYWPSVVILLKENQVLSPEDILSRAQASWGAHAPVEAIGKLKDSASYIFRSGGLIFSVNFGAGRYCVEGREHLEVLQRAWDEHTSWMSIDMPNETNDHLYKTKALGSSYQLLLVFAFKSLSANCTGVYFPAESVTIPNFGELAGSIQWCRKNGLNLEFLK